jgi:hypothetical protein
MPPEAVGRLGEALSAAGRLFINDVYAGAPHGYTMNDTPPTTRRRPSGTTGRSSRSSGGRWGDRTAGGRRVLGRGDVGRRPGQPVPRHGDRRGRPRSGGGPDDGARGTWSTATPSATAASPSRWPTRPSPSPATATTGVRSPPAPRSASAPRPTSATC